MEYVRISGSTTIYCLCGRIDVQIDCNARKSARDLACFARDSPYICRKVVRKMQNRGK